MGDWLLAYGLNMILGGSLFIGLLLLFRLPLKRLPANIRCMLWMLAGIRLLVPVTLASPVGFLPMDGTAYARMLDIGGTASPLPNLSVSGNPFAVSDSAPDLANTSNPSTAGDLAALSDAPSATHQPNLDETLPTLPAPSAVPARTLSSIPQSQTFVFYGILVVYLAGVGLFVSYSVISAIRLFCRLRFRIQRKRGDVTYYLCDGIRTAFVMGVVSPRIYVPYGTADARLPYILRHEQSHIRHFDLLKKLFFYMVLMLYWWNPLVWAAYLLFGRDMEEACDDRVISRLSDGGRMDYANALMENATDSIFAACPQASLAFPVGFGAVPAKERIIHVAGYRRPRRWKYLLSGALLLVTSSLFFTGYSAEAGSFWRFGSPSVIADTQDGDVPMEGLDITKELIKGSGISSVVDISATPQDEEETSDKHTIISENYLLKPNEDLWCYEIYRRKDGYELLGLYNYNDPLVIADEDGTPILYAMEKDFMAYVPLPLDEELQDDIISDVGEKGFYVWDGSEFTVKTDAVTGLSYMMYGDDRSWMGRLVFFNDEEKETFQKLALNYSLLFSQMGSKALIDAGDVYAEMEVKGLAARGQTGFMFINTNGIQCIDLSDAARSWSFDFSYQGKEYEALDDYFQAHRGQMNEALVEFSQWKPIFDELGIDYDSEIDTDSPQYAAAMAALQEKWSTFPAPQMTEEQAEMAIRNEMKHYDEDGDYVPRNSIPGMNGTDIPVEERHRIIEVAEEFRQEIFAMAKQEFIEGYGIGRGHSNRSEVYEKYLLSMEKEERLKGSWTIQQYEMAYNQAFAEAVRNENPAWEYGDVFDTEIVENITIEEVEARLQKTEEETFVLRTLEP